MLQRPGRRRRRRSSLPAIERKRTDQQFLPFGMENLQFSGPIGIRSLIACVESCDDDDVHNLGRIVVVVGDKSEGNCTSVAHSRNSINIARSTGMVTTVDYAANGNGRTQDF